jgi:hypothetical protein
MARKVLARGQLRDHAAVLAVGDHLRSHHGERTDLAVFYYGGRGFVARGFDAEDAR